MPILADTIDGVIGVDTHRDTLAAAALAPVGGILAQTTTPTTTDGYQQLLDVARAHVPGRRCWAVEGAGSYGAGLTAFLHAHGERVVEAARPKRPASRTGAKTDPIDAVRAGRDALAHEHLALPRCRGDREALRVLLATRRHATASRVAAINQPRGTHRRRPRGTTRRAARHDHFRPDHSLRGLAGPASQAVGAPHDGPGAAHHRGSESSTSKPRSTSSAPNSPRWWTRSRHGWSISAVLGRSPPRRSW